MGTLRVSEIKSTTESPLVISSDISISGTLLVSGETKINFVSNDSATTVSDFWVDNLNTNDYAIKVQNNLTVKESTTLGNLYMDGEILTPSFYGTEEDLYVTKNLNVENDLNVSNDLNISNDLNVTNDINVSNDLNVTNNITANGSVSATHLYGDGSNITNLPIQNVIKETFGYDSITQNSNLSDYFNLGSNTASLGDFNKSNGDYSQAFGISNTTGVDSKIFTLGDTKMHLIIFDDIDDVFLNFNTGNTITGTTYYTATTGITTVGLTSTTTTVSILTGNTNQCLNYKVRNLTANTVATISYIDCCGIPKTLILSGYSRNYKDICSIVTPTSNIGSVEIRQECAGSGYYGCKKWFYNNLNSFPVRIYFYNCNNKYTSLVLPPSSSGYTSSCIKGTPYDQTSVPNNTLFLQPTGECCDNCTTSTAVINTTTVISGITTITQVVNVPINPPYTSGCTQYLITNNAYNRVNLEIGNCDTGTFSSTTIPSYSQRCIWSSVSPTLINESWMSAYTAQFLYITSGSGATLPCTTYSAQVITTTAVTYTSITSQVTACTSYVSGFTTTTVLTGKTTEVGDVDISSPLRVGNVTLHDNKGGTYIGVITDVFTGMTSGTTITGMTVSGVTNILTNLVGGEMRRYAILTLKEELPRIGSYGYAVNSLKGRGSIASGINTKAEGIGSQSGGLYSKTTQTGEFARSSGMFSSVGDSQYSILSLMGVTSGDTPSNMYVDGVSENIKIPKNSIVGITLQANTMILKDGTGKNEKGGAMFFKDNILIHNNDNVIQIFSGSAIQNVSTTTPSLNSSRIDFTIGNVYSDYAEINVIITGIPSFDLRWGGMVTMTKLSII